MNMPRWIRDWNKLSRREPLQDLPIKETAPLPPIPARNAKRRWTWSEEQALMSWDGADEDIAWQLGRTPQAIRSKRHQLMKGMGLSYEFRKQA